ncbi:DUF448 domain-containing protein [candidate division KSB1 bacterium]|nr:DUF448 domain-containing protein [candidate division KSB1 bacterium]
MSGRHLELERTDKTSHLPIRTCAGCGGKRSKPFLLRLVKTLGEIAFDPRAKGVGRGCYVCRNAGCLARAISRRAVQRALSCTLSESARAALTDDFIQARTESILALQPSGRLTLITEQLENRFGRPVWQGRENPLDNLVLTVLSQSTNDRNRDQAFARLRQRYPHWRQVMTAEVADIADAIRPAGLANQKSSRIRDILQWVHTTYGTFDLSFLCDEAPEEIKNTFMQLKGVGIKTISVVLMFCCGADVFPVDTHVHRICKRLHFVGEKTSAEKTHRQMQPLVPAGKSYSLHMNLLKLGRTLCTARKPRCAECPIRDLCPSAEGLSIKEKSHKDTRRN